jgi:hypothetical protein
MEIVALERETSRLRLRVEGFVCIEAGKCCEVEVRRKPNRESVPDYNSFFIVFFYFTN